MMKGRNITLDREDSVISVDGDTKNESYMMDDDDGSEKASKKNFESLEAGSNEIIEMKENLNENSSNIENLLTTETIGDAIDGRTTVRQRAGHSTYSENTNNWAEHKNVAEGLMDIALLSANANQLRFLITYNNKASTYFISLGLVVLSLTLQVAVGIVLIFKRRIKRSRIKRTQTRIHEVLIGGVFMVTVINVLLAAFTTTDNGQN